MSERSNSLFESSLDRTENRLFSPSTLRNKDVILDVFNQYTPDKGNVLEIACGSGEHGAHIAAHHPNLVWQPTDIDAEHIASADAHAKADQLQNVKTAILLNVTQDIWPVDEFDMIFNANMIHISPWVCTEGLLAGAGRHLKSGGLLFMYGPYMRNGQHTADSNASFHASLKSRNETWGIRAIENVIALAKLNNLSLENITEMPANNLAVIYKKA